MTEEFKGSQGPKGFKGMEGVVGTQGCLSFAFGYRHRLFGAPDRRGISDPEIFTTKTRRAQRRSGFKPRFFGAIIQREVPRFLRALRVFVVKSVFVFSARLNLPTVLVDQVWHPCHTLDGMKMTMHIDDKLLARVMRATGAHSKTHAIDIALREIDRRAELKTLAAQGLGLTAAELRDAYDPRSQGAESGTVATNQASYVRKPRSRR